MPVSVVIPTLNEGARIAKQIKHVRAQGFEEIIVVDGDSSDNTVEQAAEADHVAQCPPGRGRQMNVGASLSTSPFILFLHADVTLPAHAKELIQRTLKNDIAGAFRTHHVPERWAGPKKYLLRLADFRSRYSPLPYGDQALFVRRNVFDQIGGFPTIELMEDLAFSRQLRAVGKIRILAQSVRVSGRRFETAPLYQTFLVNIFPALYHVGVSPKTLAKLYGNPR